MRSIRKHIIHCSDSDYGDVDIIRAWHLARGFRDVGYHFIIRRDGEIELGRPMNEIGAHCAGYNKESIGTCLIGVDNFTKKQFKSLLKVHKLIENEFNTKKEGVVGILEEASKRLTLDPKKKAVQIYADRKGTEKLKEKPSISNDIS